MEHWEIEKIGERLASMQLRKTIFLLKELKELSGLTWEDLYKKIDMTFPAPIDLPRHPTEPKFYVNSADHLRQLACGERYLDDEFLPVLAQWALKNNWGGDAARYIAQYQPKTPAEKEEIKEERERFLARLKIDWIEDARKQSISFKQERRKVARELVDVLSKMRSAEFSYADVMYMVHAWLELNPPSSDSPAAPLYSDAETQGLHRILDIEHLPNEFVLPEHQHLLKDYQKDDERDCKTYLVEFQVYTLGKD